MSTSLSPEEPLIETALHALRLLPGPTAILETIEGAVDRATARVFVETYIFRDDTLGRRFGERLAAAAARGVPVKLLYDPLGSQETDRTFFEELRRRGVDVRPYRRPGLKPGLLNPFPRDHGRAIVVDDQAFTGGAAWGDQWLPRSEGGEGWHDVCIEIVRGPIVGDFAHLFEMRWREAAGSSAPCDLDTGEKYPDLVLVADCPAERAIVFQRHRHQIRTAKSRVWIENAYFFPPAPMLRDLAEAARRGVDVKVIVPEGSDLPIISRAARSEFAQWLSAGIAIFEYGQRMMHSKFAVVDDDWCTIGTFNANATSLAMANEVNLFVHDPRFVARAAELFERDLAASTPVDQARARRGSLIDRAVDRMAATALGIVETAFGPRGHLSHGPEPVAKATHPAA
jgi:cardiolipin synthase